MKSYFFYTRYTEADIQAEHYGKVYHMHCELYKNDSHEWQISAQTDNEVSDNDWLEFSITIDDDDAKKIVSTINSGCLNVDIQDACNRYFETHPNY